MRNKRHYAILSLIQSKNIETQQELTKALSEYGFDVTQATVSRDIKELRLVKRLNDNGRYVYTHNSLNAQSDVSEKMSVIFSKSVTNIDYALNIIVIKTLSGMAQGAAAALDALHFPEFLGSIAGDDTIIVIARNEEAALKFCEKLKKMI